MKALEAGLDTNFENFKKLHEKRWKKNDYAGWSVAYILTKYFNWTAVLLLTEDSPEYDLCIKNFKKDKKYHVWRQPDIPVKRIYNMHNERKEIDSLLALNEFGWGFSYQGWHTWVTRFKTLKQCNWSGSPNREIEDNELIWKSKVVDYFSFYSHIIVFPPKKENPKK